MTGPGVQLATRGGSLRELAAAMRGELRQLGAVWEQMVLRPKGSHAHDATLLRIQILEHRMRIVELEILLLIAHEGG